MIEKSEIYAAVDLGSNSFHMIVAEIINHQLHVIDTHKDMVRLASGLGEENFMTNAKMDEAIESLEKIGQRIKHIPKSHLRVVGTNTLRKAKNSEEFMQRAETALGKPIDIISGREEARILYLGVSHSLPSNQGKRLVIDIGGGSTELIIGQEFDSLLCESLHMGCVSFTKKFFADGLISKKNFAKAVLHAQSQLLSIANKYKSTGWDIVIGASGSMHATSDVMVENNFSRNINKKSLEQLIQQCYGFADIENLKKLTGLSSRRQPVFIGGLAIIKALFNSLELKSIQTSSGALREGIIYDLSGRLHHNDIRQRSIDKLVKQFEIDVAHSQRVQKTIDELLNLSNIKLTKPQYELLNWASQLHELGLNISHSHFEKHTAYIISHAHMPGFSTQEQLKLSVIVALLRGTIANEWLQKLSTKQQQKLLPLLLIFRIAILFNRPRTDISIAIADINLTDEDFKIQFQKDWLQNHPLTHEDLQLEVKYLQDLNIKFVFNSR